MRKNDKTYQKQLIKAFGPTIWDATKHEIKSDVLGEIVFKDKSKRAILNSLSHWRIFRDIFYQIFYSRVYLGEKKVILDAPLLFETRLLEFICMPIILVYLPDKEMQVERIIKRDKLTRE
jgi:dephospho-CoA kinase